MKLNTKEAREFIEKIYSDNKDYYSDARGQGLLKVLNKIHSSHAYVAEIIQNAIDADADKIIFKILGDNKLLIEHNGKEFSKQDVKSICEAGTSKKLATDIGFMGIGFKSVYERFQKVAISSHPWKFYFDCPRKEYGLIEQVNKTLPIWDDTIKSPSPKMTCRFELSKPHSKQEKRIQEILKDDLNYVMGENNDLLVMLACQGIQEIIWDDQEWLLEKERVDINYNNVNTNKIIAINNKNYLEWIHLSKSYHPNEKAKKAFYDHRLNEVYLISENIKRKVEVFTRLNDKGVPIMSKTGKSFAVLPMGVSLPFSLNVQADWLVDATRKNTLENNEWHRQIVLQIPKLMAAFLKWSTKNYATDGDSDIYKCLPNFNSKETIISSWFDNDDFKNKLKNELEDLKILPILTQKGYKYISPRKAKLLQESFDILIDNRYKPWLLLGEQAVFRKFISKRLVSVLKELELKNNMSLEFLVNYWEKQPIRKWFTCLGEDKFEALFQLYEILNKLYTRYKYQELLTDDVPCLLLENGTFDTLKNTYSFPKDWFTFIQENSDLAKELKSNLVDEYNIINEKLLHYYIYNSDKELDDFF